MPRIPSKTEFIAALKELAEQEPLSISEAMNAALSMQLIQDMPYEAYEQVVTGIAQSKSVQELIDAAKAICYRND